MNNKSKVGKLRKLISFSRNNESSDSVSEKTISTANESMERIVNNIIRLDYDEIDEFEFPKDEPFGLQVVHDNDLFCFIIRFSSSNDNLICLGPGAHPRDRYVPPYFDRWSWFKHFDESTIAYADPIFFMDDKIRLGWFTAGKEWHMKTLASIIEKLSANQGIINENMMFFGASGGGFTSVALAALIKKSKALVNNSQFFVMNYNPGYLDELFEVLEKDLDMKRDEIIEKYDYRFDLIKLFEKENYAPSVTYYLNTQSQADIEKHGNPFIEGLKNFEKFNGLNICTYEEFKEVPHEPLPTEITIDIIKHFSKVNLNNTSQNDSLLIKYDNINGLESEQNYFKILNSSMISGGTDEQELVNQLNSANTELALLKKAVEQYSKYSTARIDISNEGRSTNRVEILDISDENADVMYPSWFKTGALVSSEKGNLKLKFKCIGKGTINITFRAIDFRYDESHRLPIYIKYTNIVYNGKVLVDSDQYTCHDDPIIYKRTIKNNEIIELDVNWMPI